MDKFVTKKTVRLTSFMLAVLIVLSVLPFGADKTLQAQAETDSEKITYTVELVDDNDNILPIDGVNVTLTLTGGLYSEDIDENGVNLYSQSKTSENGCAVFEDVIPYKRYQVTLAQGEGLGYKIGEEYKFYTEIENIDGAAVLVPFDMYLDKVDYTVLVKNNTNLQDYADYDMTLSYWQIDNKSDIETVKDYKTVSDDTISFTINGILGKTYGIQAGGIPFVEVGRSDIKLNGQTQREDGEPDLELDSKKFTVKFDKQSFENAYVYDVTEREDITSENLSAADFDEDSVLDLDDEFELFFGDSPRYAVVAKDGYRIDNYKLNREKTDILEENDAEEKINQLSRCLITVDNIKQPTTVTANIVKKTYEVSFTIGANGAVIMRGDSEELANLGGIVTVTNGDKNNVSETSDFTVTAVSEDGYHIGSFTYKETDKKISEDVLKENNPDGYARNAPKKSVKTINNVHSSYTFDIKFDVDEFFVETEESGKGTISFPDNIKKKDNKPVVNAGDSLTVNVTPKKGCHIENIKIFRKNNDEDKYGENPDNTIYLLDGENLKDSGKGSYSFDIPNIGSDIKIIAEYAEDVTVSMNQIAVTNPYKKDLYDKYVRYTYRNDTLKDVSISYTVVTEDGETVGLRGTAKTEKGDESFGGYGITEYSMNRFGSYARVTSVEIYYDRQWHKVNLENGDILFILDETSPTNDGYLSKEPVSDWTNKPSVKISGKLDMKNENANTADLDCVVWSRDVNLKDEEVRAVQLGGYSSPYDEFGVIRAEDKTSGNFDTAKGTFDFTVSGEQESRYYIYALDESGNICNFRASKETAPIGVGIDNTKPIIYEFKIHDTDKSGNAVTFDEFGVTAANAVTVDVTAWDYNSGISSITLYGYDQSGGNAETLEITNENKTDSVNYTAAFEIDVNRFVSLAATAVDRAGNKIDVPVLMSKENSNSYIGNVITGTGEIVTDIKGDSDKIKHCEKQDDENILEWYNTTDFNVEYSAEESRAGFSRVEMNIITYDTEDQTKITKVTPVKYLNDDNILENALAYDYTDNNNIILFNSGNVHKSMTTKISNTVNIKSICDVKENKLNFGEEIKDGRNTLQVIVYSRTHSGKTEYVSKSLNYDFYLDTKKPTINSITFTPKKKNVVQTVINVLTFGLFANGNLQVDVEIEDGEVYSSSGYKNVNLIYNGEVIQTVAPEIINRESGSADTVQTVGFVIPEKDITSKGRFIDGIITAEVYDNTENASGQFTPKASDTDPERSGEISYMMIENAEPVISDFKIETQYEDRNSNTYDGNIWYNKDIVLGIEVSDADSGIGKVQADVNGTTVKGSDGSDYLYNSDKPNVLKLEQNFVENSLVKTNADGVTANEDGEYAVTVRAVDNAGNKAEDKKISVFKDTAAPSITRFEFLGNGNRNGDGVPNDTVEMTDYGYYFKQDTQIRIHTADEFPSSGVNNVYFKAVPTIEEGSSAVEQQAKAEPDGTCVFTVPANFKGQIFAYADDNVGNSTNRYVTPSGAIIETPEEHENEQHIFIKRLTQAPAQTGSGSPLYPNSVDVEFTVVDTYSGIRDAEVTINNRTYSVNLDNAKPDSNVIDNWSIEDVDYNLVTVIKQVITVSDNINDIPISVKMTDRSGNTSEAKDSFSIDKTPPSVKIEWDNTKPEEGSSFYNKARTAKITVTERNFSQRNFVPMITNTDGTIPSISGWSTSGSGDNTIHTAAVTFAADGEYEFSAYCFDDAGNRSNTEKTEDFAMDFTKPSVSVTYDNNESKNGYYFCKERTATIEITERNFNSSAVVIKGSGSDNGREVEFPKISDWTTVGNRHTATLKFKEDALYTFSVTVKDKAGNSGGSGGEEKFCIDKTKPSIKFSGVKNQSANSGEIAPVIEMTDKNFDKSGAKVTLYGYYNKEVTSYPREDSDIYSKDSDILIGQTDAYSDFEHTLEVDDLYTLTVDVTDKAGNISSETLEFSANRKGSVYTIDESLKDYMGGCYKEPRDIVITERNVDAISNVKMVVAVNGTPKNIGRDSDYTVEESGGGGSWSINKYTVKSGVFENSARYEVRASSVDKARNENQSDAGGEGKELDIDFVIDADAPEIKPLFNDDETIAANEYDAKVLIRDSNLIADSCKVTIDGKETTLTPDEDEDNIYHFTVKQGSGKQNIVITASDRADNVRNSEVNLTVTTNKFVIWFSSVPRLIGTVIGGVVLAGLVILAAAVLRRKSGDKDKK